MFPILLILSLSSFKSSATENFSLAGTWRFALDRQDVGMGERWFQKDLSDKIRLPGALQSQGYGDEISIKTPWVLSLYDRNWFLRADYASYTNAGDVKVPFLCQPPRHYLGAAWYQRDIDIPEDWKDRRVVLFLERPHWESRVWIDGQIIGTNDSLCVPHEFELGVALKPGKHRLTVRVDNRMILPYRPDAHSVSDSLGQSWNGIVGKMELRSTPLRWIDHIQIFSDWSQKKVVAKWEFHNAASTAGRIKINVLVSPATINPMSYMAVSDVSYPAEGITNIETEIPFPGEAAEHPVDWDEFNPKLFRLEFNPNKIGEVLEPASVSFGLRDFKADGTHFKINSRETYLRGTHNGGDFPLTGYPPTDVAYWRQLFTTCKSYGLNHMRFHSFCPPEAAFEAADQLGFYLSIEPGMWNTFDPDSSMEAMLYLETERILKAYGNHPSFVLFSPSNEPKGHWRDVLPKWAEHFRAIDPRRLYTSGSGFTDSDAPGPLDKVDYTTTGRFGPRRARGESGWFGNDYSPALEGVTVPVIAHELGQWCAYPDFDVIKKFTGYLRPGNYEMFRDSAKKHGVLEYNNDFARASGKFQLACYKEEIEANLRTPGMAGFQLLDLHDYVGQGTALVGLLDPFWESKGYATPEDFKQFCNTVVPLARMTKRVFTTDETLNAQVDVANFSARELPDAISHWQVRNPFGKTVAEGRFKMNGLPLGKSTLGNITTPLAKLSAPGAYKLMVQIEETLTSDGIKPLHFENSWDFWLYPAQLSNATPTNVLVTSSWDDASARLNEGGKVLFQPRSADLDWFSPPLDRVPVFWNRLMNPGWGRMLGLWCDTNHPALAEFPTDENCDWQWTELLRNARALNIEKLPLSLRPIVAAVDDWNRNWKLATIFEAKVGRGNLLVCSIDLSRSQSPVARQLLRSLLDYAASERFQPKSVITIEQFRGLHFDSRVMRKLGATVEAAGQNANALIDGDPNTFWSVGGTGRGTKPVPFPHELTVSFPSSVAMDGLVLMPRQNDRDHLGDVRAYKIATSDDATNWTEIANGELVSTWDPQRISFGKTVQAKNVRFTAVSGFGNDSSTALAELAVSYAGPKLPENNAGDVEFKRVRSTSSDVDEGGETPVRRK